MNPNHLTLNPDYQVPASQQRSVNHILSSWDKYLLSETSPIAVWQQIAYDDFAGIKRGIIKHAFMSLSVESQSVILARLSVAMHWMKQRNYDYQVDEIQERIAFVTRSR